MRLKRAVSMILTLAMLLAAVLPCSALADAELLPQLKSWDMESHPVRLKLSASFESLMPFDENRLAQFNNLIKHISLAVGLEKDDTATASKINVMVDGNTAVSLQMKEDDVFRTLYISTIPDTVFQTQDGQSPFELLFGEEEKTVTLLESQFTGADEVLQTMQWMDDGIVLAGDLTMLLRDWAKESEVKTKVKNMGIARKKTTIVIQKAEADRLGPLLVSVCPDGWLKQFLSGLVFTGKQTFVISEDEAGHVLKVSYQGQCGTSAETLRDVKFNWAMCRGDAEVKDEITLRAIPVKGSDKNVLSYSRELKAGEDGSASYEVSMKNEVTVNRQKTVSTMTADLKTAGSGDSVKLEGSVVIKMTPPDTEEEPVRTIILTPDCTVSKDKIAAEGTIGVETKSGKRTQTKASIALKLSEVKPFEIKTAEKTVDVDFVSFDRMTILREQASMSVAKALISPLVLLPYEDTLYLSQDLSAEAWQSIVDSARTISETEEVE